MSLMEFVEATDGPTRSLVLVNWEAPRPLQQMLEGLFEDQPVDITEQERDTEATDTVYLVEDGTVIATSPLEALQEAILLVNSDLYMTGSGGLESLAVPDVIDGLTDIRFQLRGYPEAHKEKLLLIIISRYIERLALEGDGGRHRASFQRLSRINDEQGTRSVYERLAASATDTHVYGVPDWTPPPEFDVTIHGGWTGEFRDAWFVVYTPSEEAEECSHAALVAVQSVPRCWEGFWTFDPKRVTAINDYIERSL